VILSNRQLEARIEGYRDERLLGLIPWRRRLEEWERLIVGGMRPGAIQPCSIDVHLGKTLLVYEGPQMDTRRDNSPWWRELPLTRVERGSIGETIYQVVDNAWAWVLRPGCFYLSVLDEYIRVPEDCCAQLAGVSSRARDGIMIHQQAGLLDPGWEGRATLEMTVGAPHTVLYPGQRIGQVTLTQLGRRAVPAYRGRYQHDCAPQPARLHPYEAEGRVGSRVA
jgi:dCTP deaminase